MKEWFTVDRAGLAQLLERRGKEFAILELLSNAWDEPGVTEVEVIVERIPTTPFVEIQVLDDAPEGFTDLSHAFTLFAESAKKANAEQRGRFNLGEKLFLALCNDATIMSTTGGVRFDDGGRHRLRNGTARGSMVRATMRMTNDEMFDVSRAVGSLIPPRNIRTVFNGEELLSRTAVVSFMTTLATEIASESGVLRRTRRETLVTVYEPREGETPSIYEMGVPVVATGDRWHYDIGQKVPLNMERDNVTPAFLQDVRTAVLNATHDLIEEEDATRWVRDALEDPAVESAAVESAVRVLFGAKAVAYDPSDPEANNVAVSQGYSVVYGRQLSKATWENVRAAGALRPAGQVTPSNAMVHSSPDGIPPIDPANWTPSERRIAVYAQAVGEWLLGGPRIAVDIFHTYEIPKNAWYGGHRLALNAGRLGRRWFAYPDQEEVDALLIHEFAHDAVSNHLSDAFYRECCRLGAKLRWYAIALAPIEAAGKYERQP